MFKLTTILFLTVVALATPCSAWAMWGTSSLSDSEQPGSVIVFPKFIRGTVFTPDQGTKPVTDFEVSVTCPGGGTNCFAQSVTIRFHWVCPGSTILPTFPCREVDFNLTTTTKGTLHFNPENIFPANRSVPPPPCPEGFLVGWVINGLGQPIKFDALIGDAVIRESSTASAAYNAVAIQAAAGLPTNASTDVNLNGALDFDGTEYQGVSGKIFGNVRYDVPGTATPFTVSTSLTLLTLDVLSNLPNNPVFVDLNFYNENENLHSTGTSFSCFEQIPLSVMDPGLTAAAMGTPKGMFESVRAEKVQIIDSDKSGPVTLLGLVLTREFDPVTGALLREYAYLLSHDSTPVVTAFAP
jgi:hypothetical protein